MDWTLRKHHDHQMDGGVRVITDDCNESLHHAMVQGTPQRPRDIIVVCMDVRWACSSVRPSVSPSLQPPAHPPARRPKSCHMCML